MSETLVPNEHGVLVPESSLPASETERVLALAANGGGSGLGMSHYSQASRCGRKARLSQERNAHFASLDSSTLPATKNHFVIGSVMHKLHELARTEHEHVLDYSEQFANLNVAEGVRLYRGWLRHWGLDFWGECIAVEAGLEDSETFEYGDCEDSCGCNDIIPVTGAIDMVVEMDEAACERAKRRGLELTPGRRIIDWKSADGPSDGSQYAGGLQALWYPHLWNLHNPERPVDGIIFDVVMKRSRRKDRTVLPEDFQAFYIPYGMESVDALRGMVQQGHRNVVEDIPNRSECVSWRGEVCAFRLNGACNAE